MNRQFAVIITVATVLLVVLLIALSVFRSSPQSSEQIATEIVIPTTSPNNRFNTSSSNSIKSNEELSTIKSNDEVQLSSDDSSAVENAIKKLPIDSGELKVEFSNLLDTFYIQNTATDGAQLNQFLSENNLLNLYKSQPKFFKFVNQYPKDVMDEDEYSYISDNGLSESIHETKKTPQETRLAPLKNLLKSLVAFDFPTPSVAPGGAVAPQPASGSVNTSQPPTVPNQATQPPTSVINTANCANIVGNEKIVCSALKYTGIRYGFASSTRGNEQSKKTWGVVSKGQNGHSPATWIAQRIPGGNNDFLECSGYTAVAIYDAFGVVADHCSVNYYGAANFKKIDINTARAGDLLIKGTGCATSGGGGHIGIFVKRLANGRIQTLESTPRGSGRSGYYEVAPTFFTRAVRYTGPGSTP